jgi:hypothetical protein
VIERRGVWCYQTDQGLYSLHCDSRHWFFGLSGVTCKSGTPKPPCCGGRFLAINHMPVPPSPMLYVFPGDFLFAVEP